MLEKRNIIYKETWGTANALVISTSNHDKGVTTDLDILQARNGYKFKSGSSNASHLTELLHSLVDVLQYTTFVWLSDISSIITTR